MRCLPALIIAWCSTALLHGGSDYAGTYLFSGGGAVQRVQITGLGRFTTSFGISGQFDAHGFARLFKDRNILGFRAEWEDFKILPQDRLEITLFAFAGKLGVFTRRYIAEKISVSPELVGYYTGLVKAEDESSTTGWAFMRIKSNGNVRVAGQLPNGARFLTGTFIVADTRIALVGEAVGPDSTKTTTFVGRLKLQEQSSSIGFAGTVQWKSGDDTGVWHWAARPLNQGFSGSPG